MGLSRKNQVESEAQTEEVVEEQVETAEAVSTDQVEDAASAEPVETVEEPAKAVAVASQRAVAVADAPSRNIIQEAADEGFEGLQLDFTSFDIVTLNQGEFLLGEKDDALGDHFDVVIMQSRKKYAFVSGHPEDQREVKYSYDADAATEDREVMDAIAEWKEDGVSYVVKEYLEAAAEIVDDGADGENNGDWVILQIPPTSKGKFSGYYAKNKAKGRGSMKDYVTRISKGKKVTKATNPFTPWAFDYVGPANS